MCRICRRFIALQKCGRPLAHLEIALLQLQRRVSSRAIKLSSASLRTKRLNAKANCHQPRRRQRGNSPHRLPLYCARVTTQFFFSLVQIGLSSGTTNVSLAPINDRFQRRFTMPRSSAPSANRRQCRRGNIVRSHLRCNASGGRKIDRLRASFHRRPLRRVG